MRVFKPLLSVCVCVANGSIHWEIILFSLTQLTRRGKYDIEKHGKLWKFTNWKPLKMQNHHLNVNSEKLWTQRGFFIQLGFSWGLNCLWFFILFERFKTFSFLNEKTLMLYWSFCPTFNLPLWRNWNSPQFLQRGKRKNGSTTTNCSVRKGNTPEDF